MFGAVSAGIPSFGDLAWKSPVRVVQVGALPSQSTTAQTIFRSSNGALPAIDGVSLSVGDRLLVADQSPGYVEGIYVVASLGSAGSPWLLRRARDCDATAEMVVGATVYVSEGTKWAGTTATAGASWSPTSGDADWQPTPQLRTKVTRFFSSGTWTKDNPLASVNVVVVGGGGAGGGTQATGATTQASGGGGAGGGTAIKTFRADQLAATEPVTVGTGGTGVTAGSGNPGVTSRFATGKAYEVTGSPGSGGTVGAASAGGGRRSPGAGGVGIGGDVNFSGADGGWGQTIGGDYLPSGFGGGSYLAGSVSPPASFPGSAGYDWGGGGSGATMANSGPAQAGGDGANGIVIVTETWIGRGSWT